MTGTTEEERIEIHLALVATLKDDVAEGRRVVERYRRIPPLQFPNFIELCAQTGYPDLAIDRIRNNHNFYNYRWEHKAIRKILSHLETRTTDSRAPP